ncbi:hypothetical protein K502DRAFT_351458, partial [Neoconidiobolus thromboides FSU 785]
ASTSTSGTAETTGTTQTTGTTETTQTTASTATTITTGSTASTNTIETSTDATSTRETSTGSVSSDKTTSFTTSTATDSSSTTQIKALPSDVAAAVSFEIPAEEYYPFTIIIRNRNYLSFIDSDTSAPNMNSVKAFSSDLIDDFTDLLSQPRNRFFVHRIQPRKAADLVGDSGLDIEVLLLPSDDPNDPTMYDLKKQFDNIVQNERYRLASTKVLKDLDIDLFIKTNNGYGRPEDYGINGKSSSPYAGVGSVTPTPQKYFTIGGSVAAAFVYALITVGFIRYRRSLST